MSYATCFRMALTGTTDGREIEGTAWTDRRWGEYSWLATRRPKAGPLDPRSPR